ALAGAVLLIIFTIATEVLTRRPMKAAAVHAVTRNALAGAGRRNAEVLHAMGMAGRMAALWGEANRLYLAAHEQASDVGGGLAAPARAPCAVPRAGRADGSAQSKSKPPCRGGQRGGARRAEAHYSRCGLFAQKRASARGHRAECGGQIDPGTRSGRCVGSGA